MKLSFVIFFISGLSLSYSKSDDINAGSNYVNNWDEKEWNEIKDHFNSIAENLDSSFGVRNIRMCNSIPKRIKERIKIFKYPDNFEPTTNETYSYTIGNYEQDTSGMSQMSMRYKIFYS